MSILENYSNAIKNKDETLMNQLLHDDFKFTMHKSGNTLGKADEINMPNSYTEIQAIFDAKCVGCHGEIVDDPTEIPNILNMQYDKMFNREFCSPHIVHQGI